MTDMMKVGLLAEPGRFIVEERPIPEVGPGEVRIRVAACGICGTDLHAYNGHTPGGWKIVFPFQMGHELSGVIDAMGEGIPEYTGLKLGDRVVPDGRMPCRFCQYCRRGQFNLCKNMSYISGGFAQYMVYPYRNLVKVPDNVPLDAAAFGEPLACVVNGNSQLSNVPFAAFGLVIGAGPIGLLHLQMLKMRGLTTAIADLRDHRLQAARDLGADHVIDVRTQDLKEEIKRLTDGYMADVVISAAGGDERVIDQAIDVAGKRGQIVYFGAVMKTPMTVGIDSIHYRETQLLGSHDSTIAQYETAMKLLGNGKINAEPIISHRYPLEEIWDAFKFAATRDGIKVMVVNEGVE